MARFQPYGSQQSFSKTICLSLHSACHDPPLSTVELRLFIVRNWVPHRSGPSPVPLAPDERRSDDGGASWLGWTQSVPLLGAGELSMQTPSNTTTSTCPLCSLVDGFMAWRGSVCLALVKAAARGLVKSHIAARALCGGPRGSQSDPTSQGESQV